MRRPMTGKEGVNKMFKLHGFGNQLLVVIAFLLVVPVIVTLYMLHVIKNSELALVENQKAKLLRAVDELDLSTGESFNDILKKHGALNEPKAEKVRVLNNQLKTHIAEIMTRYPGVEVGFYSSELDVMLDGSENYEENFSRRRKSAFEKTINQQEPMVQTFGRSVGGILEAYKPLYRHSQLQGVIWATENLSNTNYYKKFKQVEQTSYAIIIMGIVFGLGSSLVLMQKFVKYVDQIKKGLQTLQFDLKKTLPPAPGELGEISKAINRLAIRLSDVHKYNEIMLATIDDGLLVVDSRGKVVIANSAATRILGLLPDSLEKKYTDIFPADSPFPSLLARTIEEHRQFKDVKVKWVSPSRKTLELLASTAVLMDSKQEIIGTVLCCRDVTERMRLEERVYRQERLAALGKLVAGVAHEIRNPLTSISCYIQLWQRHNNPSPRSLATMQQEVTRLDTLVNQLLYFAKPAEAKFSTQNLNQLVEKVLQFFTELYPGKYTIIKSLAVNLPPAWIDPEQIERVLMNLIFNAIQAMPDGGRLEVKTVYDAVTGAITTTVSDSGCGIAPEALSHLFDPFYSTKPKGTGLGLAIAYEIIRAHGGNIEVESKPGQGTTFRFFVQTSREENYGAKSYSCS